MSPYPERVGKRATLPDDSRDLLRVYLDAVTLIEPFEHDIWQRAQVTLVQARMLRRLRDGAKIQSDLGASLGLSAPSTTRLIDRLEAQGIVDRTRDGDDARRVHVSLTPKGRALFATTRLLQGSPVEKASLDMEPERRALLADLLRELVAKTRAHLTEDDATGSPK